MVKLSLPQGKVLYLMKMYNVFWIKVAFLHVYSVDINVCVTIIQSLVRFFRCTYKNHRRVTRVFWNLFSQQDYSSIILSKI